jgi:hypothetical protein
MRVTRKVTNDHQPINVTTARAQALWIKGPFRQTGSESIGAHFSFHTDQIVYMLGVSEWIANYFT